MTTYGSTAISGGGPWGTTIQGQDYIQYSTAFGDAVADIMRQLGLFEPAAADSPRISWMDSGEFLALAFPQR